MKLELKFDNGVIYSLTIPEGLFNTNTKNYILETFTEWINVRFEKEGE